MSTNGHACPECDSQLRQTIHIVLDCPIPCHSVDKKAIRSKNIRIDAALWDEGIVYCAKCGYHYRKDSNA